MVEHWFVGQTFWLWERQAWSDWLRQHGQGDLAASTMASASFPL